VGHPRRLSQVQMKSYPRKRDVTLTNHLVLVEVEDNSHKAMVVVVEQEGEVEQKGAAMDHEDVNLVYKVVCEISMQMKQLVMVLPTVMEMGKGNQYLLYSVVYAYVYFHSYYPDDKDWKWSIHKMKSNANTIALKELPSFECSSGPAPRKKQENTPLSMFQLFLTALLLSTIVVQTNDYAQAKGVSSNMCVEELRAFIGINIAMGMLRLPQICDYWSSNEVLSTPWFGTIMARDRFFDILRYLHLSDSSSQDKNNPVHILVDHLLVVFPHY